MLEFFPYTFFQMVSNLFVKFQHSNLKLLNGWNLENGVSCCFGLQLLAFATFSRIDDNMPVYWGLKIISEYVLIEIPTKKQYFE